MKAVEGQSMPSMDALAWIGTDSAQDKLKRKISVISLLGAGGDLSAAHCQLLQKLHEQFSSAGVRFVGVYRTGTATDGVKTMFEAQKFEFLAAVDVPANATEGSDPSKTHGSIAGALGIRFWPIVLIADRTGKVRVAGAHPERIADALNVMLAEPTESEATGDETLERIEGKDAK